LKYKKKFMKMPKCYYEYFDDGSVYVADWNDNYVVAMMTNFDHILQRNVQGQLGKSQVDQPFMIVNNTAGMGGVDLIDSFLHVFCPQIN